MVKRSIAKVSGAKTYSSKTASKMHYVRDTKLQEPARSKLFVPINLYADILSYCVASPGEIRSYGFVKLQERAVSGNEFRLHGLILPEQTVTGASVHVSQDAMLDMLIKADAAGLNMNDMRFVFHSHVDFEPFWSETDVGDVNHTGDGLAETPWLINMVINRGGIYLCRIDQFEPLRFHEDMDVVLVAAEADITGAEQIREDVERLVTIEQPAVVAYGEKDVIGTYDSPWYHDYPNYNCYYSAAIQNSVPTASATASKK